MHPDTDVCQTEQPQISYSVDFTAEQSSAMGYGITYLIGSGGIDNSTRYNVQVDIAHTALLPTR